MSRTVGTRSIVVSLLLALAVGPVVLARPAAGAAPPTAVRFVAAGRPVHNRQGVVWAPDRDYARGGSYVVGTHAISGTHYPDLFRRQRVGHFTYRVGVAPGTYRVQLRTAELSYARAGQRVFDVLANGRTVVRGVDPYAGAAGRDRADTVTFSAAAPDGVLLFAFRAVHGTPAVGSISLARIPTPPTTTYVRPESFGARGDGRTDDTTALQAALDAGSAQHPVWLAPGRSYAHAGLLHVRRAGEVVTGGGTLLATDEAESSVWLEADHVALDGITVSTATTTQRWGTWDQMGVRVVGSTGVTLRDVTVHGSAAAGIYVGGGANAFLLDHVTVQDTRADGIHVTEGAHDGRIVDPIVHDSGDDGVAVVSYAQDGAPCHDITITSPTVQGTTWGRGLSVVGGTRIAETGIKVSDTDAAAVYIGDEGAPWYTSVATDVSVTGGTITRANTDAGVDHGAVVVLSGQHGVQDAHITVSGLHIADTRASASRDLGVITYGTAPADVLFQDLTITGGPHDAYSGNTPQSSYRLRNIRQNGRRLPDAG